MENVWIVKIYLNFHFIIFIFDPLNFVQGHPEQSRTDEIYTLYFVAPSFSEVRDAVGEHF